MEFSVPSSLLPHFCRDFLTPDRAEELDHPSTSSVQSLLSHLELLGKLV